MDTPVAGHIDSIGMVGHESMVDEFRLFDKDQLVDFHRRWCNHHFACMDYGKLAYRKSSLEKAGGHVEV